MSNRRFGLWMLAVILAAIAIAVAAGWFILRPQTGDQPASAASSSGRSPLGGKTVTQHFRPGDCSDHCPKVTVKTLRFDKAPKLTARLGQRLLGMAQLEGKQVPKPPADFHAYADRLFRQSRANHRQYPETAPYSAQFKAKVASQHDGLLIVRLDTYTFLGGAHGMPVTRYLVIDEDQKRIVSLDDMLRPGQHKAFEARLRAAHARWAGQQSIDRANWPFTPSDNAAPLPEAMAVTYQAYDIAPYAAGQPTLHIPYEQLRGILKPRFVPTDNADQRNTDRSQCVRKAFRLVRLERLTLSMSGSAGPSHESAAPAGASRGAGP